MSNTTPGQDRLAQYMNEIGMPLNRAVQALEDSYNFADGIDEDEAGFILQLSHTAAHLALTLFYTAVGKYVEKTGVRIYAQEKNDPDKGEDE